MAGYASNGSIIILDTWYKSSKDYLNQSNIYIVKKSQKNLAIELLENTPILELSYDIAKILVMRPLNKNNRVIA